MRRSPGQNRRIENNEQFPHPNNNDLRKLEYGNRDDIKRTSIRIFTKDFAIFVALAYARRLSWRQDDHVALMYLLTTRKELTGRLDQWRFVLVKFTRNSHPTFDKTYLVLPEIFTA